MVKRILLLLTMLSVADWTKMKRGTRCWILTLSVAMCHFFVTFRLIDLVEFFSRGDAGLLTDLTGFAFCLLCIPGMIAMHWLDLPSPHYWSVAAFAIQSGAFALLFTLPLRIVHKLGIACLFIGLLAVLATGCSDRTEIDLRRTELDCNLGFLRRFSNRKLTRLDVSRYPNLTILQCSDHNLTELDLSGNRELIKLFCSFTELIELDLSENLKLDTIDCGNNSFAELDLSGNGELIKLYCGNNRLTELDLSGNRELTELHCYKNKLSELDLSGSLKLTELVE